MVLYMVTCYLLYWSEGASAAAAPEAGFRLHSFWVFLGALAAWIVFATVFGPNYGLRRSKDPSVWAALMATLLLVFANRVGIAESLFAWVPFPEAMANIPTSGIDAEPAFAIAIVVLAAYLAERLRDRRR